MKAAWPTVKLGEVLRQRKEFVLIDDQVEYARPRVRLHAQGIVLRDRVPGALIKTKRQQVCRPGELLVAEIDAKAGGFGIVPTELEGSIVSSHYFLYQVLDSRLDVRFLDFYVRTSGFMEQVQAQGTTNYAAIRPSDVLNYEIPLPPIAEQRRIVAGIEGLAEQIKEARALREQTAIEAQALLKSSLRCYLLGCAAQSVPLNAVCKEIIDNLHSNPQLSESGIPCVRSPDVGYGTLNLENAQTTDEAEYLRRTARGIPTENDIVLVREGGGVGKCALVLKGQRFSLGQRVMMLRPDQSLIHPKFLLHQLLSPLVQEDQIRPLCKGSASPHLNISTLKRFSILLPPMSEQRAIIDKLDLLSEQVETLNHFQTETAAELAALMPAILDRAFKGEL